MSNNLQTCWVGKELIDVLMDSSGDLRNEDMPVKDKKLLLKLPRNKLKTPSGKSIESVFCHHDKDRINSKYQCGNNYLRITEKGFPFYENDRGYLGELGSLIAKLYWATTTYPSPPQRIPNGCYLQIRRGHFRKQPCGRWVQSYWFIASTSSKKCLQNSPVWSIK